MFKWQRFSTVLDMVSVDPTAGIIWFRATLPVIPFRRSPSVSRPSKRWFNSESRNFSCFSSISVDRGLASHQPPRDSVPWLFQTKSSSMQRKVSLLLMFIVRIVFTFRYLLRHHRFNVRVSTFARVERLLVNDYEEKKQFLSIPNLYLTDISLVAS